MIEEESEIREINRKAIDISIPLTARKICDYSCFHGSISSLNLEGTNIIRIGRYAFSQCHSLKSVRFPSSLKDICKSAFNYNNYLAEIIFPKNSNLRKIGNRAFRKCYSLTKVEFPQSVEIIGEYAFIECCNILEFDLSKTKVRYIGLDAFKKKLYAATVSLPSTVSTISVLNNNNSHISINENHSYIKKDGCGYYNSNGKIFQGSKKLRHLLIRKGVKTISMNCFAQSKIVSITIPASVVEICESAFFYCESLKHVRFAENSRLEEIKENAFRLCDSIKELNFPKSLKIIRSEAIISCRRLESVSFPTDSQLEIIEDAFQFSRIKELILPPSVRKIGNVSNEMVFLESMHVYNDYYKNNEEGTAIFSKDGKELFCTICRLNNFAIPEGVRVIKERAFSQSLLPKHFVIPASVEVIEKDAFKDCHILIEFAEGSRIRKIHFSAFDVLNDLIINNEHFKKLDNGVVISINPRGIVFVPKNLTELEIAPNIEVIYSNAFMYTKIRSLSLPKSLKKIHSKAFYQCQLESVIFEEGTELDFIGSYAFYMTKIKNFKIPLIKDEFGQNSIQSMMETVEFLPHFNPVYISYSSLICTIKRIICPKSSFRSLSHIDIDCNTRIDVIEDK